MQRLCGKVGFRDLADQSSRSTGNAIADVATW